MTACFFTYAGGTRSNKKGSFVKGTGFLGELTCFFRNKDPKCCGKVITMNGYTGKGDKWRSSTERDGPTPDGEWKMRSVGWVEKYKKASKIEREVPLPPGRTDDYLIHDEGTLGSKGCIVIPGWNKSVMRECAIKDNNSKTDYTGTLYVIDTDNPSYY